MRTIQQDYRFIRKVIRSIDNISQVRSCERLIDTWINNHTESCLGYGRLITADKLRDYLYDQVSDKFPDYEYAPQ